jgi:hypothetical protein
LLVEKHENLLPRLANEVPAPRLFFTGGRPRGFFAFVKLFRELSSLSCGDDALDADGVLKRELFWRYFGFFNRFGFSAVVGVFGGRPRRFPPLPDIF